MRMQRIFIGIAVLALASLLMAAPVVAGDGGCPLLITVDDLPIAAGGLHPDPAARERIVEQYHETLHLSVLHHRNQARRLFGRDVPQILLLHANAIGAGQWGRLTLEILELRPLAGIEVSVLGDSRPGGVHGLSMAARWSLSGMSGTGAESDEKPSDAGGMTLLVFQKNITGKWEIVHDASF